jgi:hypothetical protein
MMPLPTKTTTTGISKTSLSNLNKVKGHVDRPSPSNSSMKHVPPSTAAKQISAVRQSANLLRKSFTELGRALELGSEQLDSAQVPESKTSKKCALSRDCAPSLKQMTGDMPLFQSPSTNELWVTHALPETRDDAPVSVASIHVSVNEERTRRCTEEAVQAALKRDVPGQHSDVQVGGSDQSRQGAELGATASAVAKVLFS